MRQKCKLKRKNIETLKKIGKLKVPLENGHTKRNPKLASVQRVEVGYVQERWGGGGRDTLVLH